MNNLVQGDIIPLEDKAPGGVSLIAAEQSKAIQEIQASLIISKRFPRDEAAAEDKILKDCTRPSLAEQAVYEYPRGGQTVSGPSIRLAEVMKRAWGNMESGWRELERVGNTSLIQAYAWDKESNVKEERTFSIKQIRATKKGSYPLTDERDIYENNANQAARRVRACILALIPGDIVEAAVKQCELTMASHEQVTVESINKLVEAFKKFNVGRDMLTDYVGRNLTPDALSPAMMVKLRNIFKSLQDGVGKTEDFFTVTPEVEDNTKGDKKGESKDTKKNNVDAFKEKNKGEEIPGEVPLENKEQK